MEFQFKQFALNHSHSTMKVGTDAVLLAALAPAYQSKKILDIGTGCGVVAMAMAQRCPQAKITAIDIDSRSIREARDNFSLSPFAERMQTEETSLQDFAKKDENHSQFDLIVSNPPFFVDSLNAPNRQRNLARHANMLPFAELAEGIARVASPNAQIAIILPPEQMTQLSTHFLTHQICLSSQTNIYSKPDKPIERVVAVFSLQKSPTLVSALTLRNPDNTYTQAYKNLVEDLLL